MEDIYKNFTIFGVQSVNQQIEWKKNNDLRILTYVFVISLHI